MMLTFTILILIWNWYSSGRSGRPTVTPAAVVALVSYLTYSSAWGSRWPSAGTSIISISSRRFPSVPWS